MRFRWFLLFILAATLHACTTPTTADRTSLKNDTTEVFSSCLSYAEFKKIIDLVPSDTLLIGRNRLLSNTLRLSFPDNRKIIYVELPEDKSVRPTGEPMVCLQNITLASDQACCMLIYNAKIVGGFKLEKIQQRWVVKQFSKILI